MLEECRKRPEADDATDVLTGKRPRLFDITDDDNGGDLPIGEETIKEVMKWLEQELMSTSTTVTHPDEVKESCGASFSDESSTVMASIDMSGLSYLMQQQFQSIYFFPPPYEHSSSSSSSCSSSSSSNVNFFGQETESATSLINGCDDVDESDDDNWLEMCLNCDAYDPLDLVD